MVKFPNVFATRLFFCVLRSARCRFNRNLLYNATKSNIITKIVRVIAPVPFQKIKKPGSIAKYVAMIKIIIGKVTDKTERIINVPPKNQKAPHSDLQSCKKTQGLSKTYRQEIYKSADFLEYMLFHGQHS